MNEALKIFLSLSLSGSLLILILFLCKPLYKNKLSRQWQYYIWLIVIARLLFPFTPETSFVGSVFQKTNNASIQTEVNPQFKQSGNILPQTDLLPNTTTDDGTVSNAAGLINDERLEPERNPLQNILLVATQNIWIVWLMLAITLFIRKITIYQSFVKYIKVGQVEISDIELWEQFGELVEQSGIKRAMGISVNSLISSPLIIGFFRSSIILPTTEISQSDFQYTILHELTHYKRRDMFYKWLVQFTICLHWFNPFVYLMGREINRACELSCDEAVIVNLDDDKHKAYGDTLINALGTEGNYKNSLATVTLSESKELLKERLEAIMNYNKKSLPIVCITFTLTVLLICGFTFVGAYTTTVHQNDMDVHANNPSKQVNNEIESNTPIQTANTALQLIEKEYTMNDLQALNISGIIIDVLSENVEIKRGGETLKLSYYQTSGDEYKIDTQSDKGGTIEEIKMQRTTTLSHYEPERTIFITIPVNVNFAVVAVSTNSGDISTENCVSNSLDINTQSGKVIINGGSVSKLLMAKSVTGDIQILDISTEPTSKDNFRAFLESDSGTVIFQPKDQVQNYKFIVDIGANATISVNGKVYQGGDFVLHENSVKQVYLDSGYLYDEFGFRPGLGSASFVMQDITKE